MKLVELLNVKVSQSQLQYTMGTIIEKMMAMKKPSKAKKNKIKHAKYIKYLHLYLSQNVIMTTPNNANTDNPNATP